MVFTLFSLTRRHAAAAHVVRARCGVPGGRRYEDMFQEEVAADLFRRLCGHKLGPEEIQRMAAEWAGSQTVRHSHVRGR